MKSSIVVPTYNNQDTLEETLRSVLRQDRDDWEVIVVNDGGQPPAEFLTLSDPRLRLVEAGANAGVSHARNLGLSLATGDLVLFLDSDDILGPHVLSYAVGVLADPSIDMLGVEFASVPDSALREGRAPDLTATPGPPREVTATDYYDFISCASRSLFLPSSTFFRRAALLREFGPNPWENYKVAEDTLLFMRAFTRFKVMLSAAPPQVIYRVRAGSLSRDLMRLECIRIEVMDDLSARPATTPAERAMVRCARAMRQGSARRYARHLLREHRKAEARRVLRGDLTRSFNGRSLAALAMLELGLKNAYIRAQGLLGRRRARRRG
ncbi:glycosyltransferase family 2 protein [Rubellimicrobium aerolatum]|uniref:Glycosyltransferase family 2 protein n=1 Tax=Rubellimicrobium aerolatum TaxID=490979 RepID=A0ABW0SBA8_9RHOB|nr:glycosyltransferase [Rubellimicrobium aerolatum]MBP1805493.1 glycosyltransferase involved in cell wall biosynthesis [Rubellimicrobium aerolatum]